MNQDLIRHWQLSEQDSLAIAHNNEGNQNRRLYPRFFLPKDCHFSVKIKDHRAQIIDVSYGGLSVDFGSQDKVEQLLGVQVRHQNLIQVEINALGQCLDCNMTMVFREGSHLGLCFRHDTSDELIFLKHLIHSLNLGEELASIQPLYPSHFQPSTSKGEEIEEELLAEACIESDHQGEIYRMHLGYRDGNIHYAVILEQAQLSTLQTIGMGGVLAPLAPTSRLDRRILRGAAYLLASLRQKSGDPITSKAYDLLCGYLKQPKAATLPKTA